MEQKSKKSKQKPAPVVPSKKNEDSRVFEEPPQPALLNSEGLDKLIRVSHLTVLANDLAEKRELSHTLNMPRIRELGLDVKEEELSMLRGLVTKASFQVQGLHTNPSQTEPDEEQVDDESPPTPVTAVLPDFLLASENSQPAIPVPDFEPRSPRVKFDAPSQRKNRQRSTSNDASPVIKPKKLKRSSCSQEPLRLRGKTCLNWENS